MEALAPRFSNENGMRLWVDNAARLLERAYGRFEELRATLAPERLNTVLMLRQRGRTGTQPPWAMLRHIVNHSTYHRGQVAASAMTIAE